MKKQNPLCIRALMSGFSVIHKMFQNEKEFKFMLMHLLFLQFLATLLKNRKKPKCVVPGVNAAILFKSIIANNLMNSI